MFDLTRRDFLKYMGLGTAGASAMVLAACADDSAAEESNQADQNAVVEQGASASNENYVANDNVSQVVGEVDTERKVTTNGMNADERYPLLRVAISSTPTNLNPWSSSDAKAYYTECLANWVDSEYQPRVYESAEFDGYESATVKIKDYVYDWDGNNITADDIVYMYNVYVEGAHTMKFQAFKSVEKVDDYTVKFTWNPDDYQTLGSLEKVWCDPVVFSQKAYESRNFAADPAYTGQYKIVDYIDGNSIILEAWDEYWETDESKLYPEQYRNIQRVELMVIAEASQQVMALQNGTIDYSSSVSTENLDYFQEGGEYSEKYNVAVNPANNVYMMIPNEYPGKITADKNFRLACFYAIDNATVAKAVGACEALKAWANPVYPEYKEAWAEQETYINTYDLELAKEYLAKSAYNGEKIVLLAESNETWKLTLQTIQMLLLQINVETDIQLLDSSILREETKDPDNFDFTFAWMGGALWTGAINTQFEQNKYPSIDPEMCNGFLKDDELQTKFKLARTVDGHTEENIDDLYQYVIENAYHYGIFTLLNNFVYIKDIAGLYLQNGFSVQLYASTFYLD